MRNADYYKDGQWNFFCDFCGRKAKSSEAMLTWDGHRVCSFHKEARNPQDFLRGVKDDQTVPWSRPETLPEVFVPSPAGCTLQGSNAIPSYAIPGCCYPNHVNMAFLPSASTRPPDIYPQNATPGYATPGMAIPGIAFLTE